MSQQYYPVPPVPTGSPAGTRCSHCGAVLPNGSVFCSVCGQKLEPNGSLPYGTYVSPGEYRRKYAPASFAKSLRTISIIAYVMVGINVLYALLIDVWVLLDAALFLGFTLGMHLGRSKGCAIGLLVLACVEMILGLINGALTGYYWVILGIGAVVLFVNTDKQYKAQLAQSRGVYQ